MVNTGTLIYHSGGSLTDFHSPRILRLYEVVDFSVHDIVLVDCSRPPQRFIKTRAKTFQHLNSISRWTPARMAKFTTWSSVVVMREV
jgi:hypothetical protein